MNVFAAMLERVQDAGDALAAAGVLPAGRDRTRVTVEPSADPAFGDMTTNAALVLAGEAGRAPRELAEAFAVRLRADASVEHAEVAGPGFVNITLRPAVWTQALRAALTDRGAYGRSRIGAGRTVQIERAPNQDDPEMSVGQGRAAIFAQAQAAVLEAAGFVVAHEPYRLNANKSNNYNDLIPFSKLADEIGRDAVRFTILFRRSDAALDFDAAKASEQSYDNPVFSVQYGHARARAVFRQAGEAFPDLPVDASGRAALLRDAALERLTDTGERALMRRVAQYPYVVETAAIAGEPHRVAVYLDELASAFHTHSRHGIATPHLRFIIQNDRELTVARLALVEAVVIIFAAGLALLGVGAPDEMQ